MKMQVVTTNEIDWFGRIIRKPGMFLKGWFNSKENNQDNKDTDTEIHFHKMCNKKRKQEDGNVCLCIKDVMNNKTQNHFINKTEVIAFVANNYTKEFLDMVGITRNDLEKLRVLKRL